MKRIVIISVILTACFLIACSSKIDKSKIKGYTPPTAIKQPHLFYPKIAQEQALWGNTKLILSINKEGVVEDVNIIKSSGHKILDSAAIDYCKNILFIPAKRDGIPINSKIVWVIKFNITEKGWDINNYLTEIFQLYRNIQHAQSNERIRIEKEILKKHNELIQNYTDALNFNNVLLKVLSTEIIKEWQKDWDGWPLSFLLYHDFIKRFQDYDSLDVVKSFLINSLKSDIKYIKNTPELDIKIKTDKEKILNKIKAFISVHYPDIILKEVDLDANINSIYISVK